MKRKLLILLAVILTLGIFVSCNKEEPQVKEPIENNIIQEKLAEKERVEVEEVAEVETVNLIDVSYLEELERKAIEVPFELSKITPQVSEYSIEPDLSNVVNAEYFGEFTEDQRKFLVENGFLITKTGTTAYDDKPEFKFDQIHQIYEENEYKMIPSFVTTDSMTHIFHIFYDGFLRNIEMNELFPKSVDMTEKLLQKNLEMYNNLENPRLKALQLKNVAFFAVNGKLLGIDVGNIPAEAMELVDIEMENIENKIAGDSPINGNKVDYSQMTVRGHYTRDEKLEKYFLSTMYYGQIGFFPFEEGRVNEDAILQALLITHSVYEDPEVFKTWAALVDPMDFLVETADDLSLREYGKMLYSVYGEIPDIENLDDKTSLEAVVKLIGDLPRPIIAPFLGQSFRFIPQRSVMDNMLMQNVVDVKVGPAPSKRPIYSGLDLMLAFGNEKAKEIQYADEYNSHWDMYKARTENNITLVQSFSDENWQKNLYRGWLWMLSSYKNTYKEGYPMFMQNEPWQRKDLVSALGSYAELKHDTVLYGKQVMAEMGGGGPVEIPKGYVEPNLELYEKLSWLLEYTKVNLEDREMLSDDQKHTLDRFQEIVNEMIRLSKKELNEEAFTEDDYQQLFQIGGWMEGIAIGFVQGEGEHGLSYWYEIENETDRRMPVVVDLMSVVENSVGVPEGYSSIATGKPAEIYVVYPQDGELHLGRGGVFTYHEFISEERLTDEKWQEKLLTEEVELPYWYEDIIFEEKIEFEGNLENYDW